jgi:hypothetical protein
VPEGPLNERRELQDGRWSTANRTEQKHLDQTVLSATIVGSVADALEIPAQ